VRFHFLFIFIFLAGIVSPAMARHLGLVGKIYPISEPDALTEIRAAVDKVNWSAVMNGDEMRERIKVFYQIMYAPYRQPGIIKNSKLI